MSSTGSTRSDATANGTPQQRAAVPDVAKRVGQIVADATQRAAQAAGERTRLRDAFAAAAPYPVPAWFPQIEPPAPLPEVGEVPCVQSVSDARERQLCERWMRDPVDRVSEWVEVPSAELRDFEARMLAYAARRSERERLRAEQERERFFAWRWWYADRMLEARDAMQNERDTHERLKRGIEYVRSAVGQARGQRLGLPRGAGRP